MNSSSRYPPLRRVPYQTTGVVVLLCALTQRELCISKKFQLGMRLHYVFIHVFWFGPVSSSTYFTGGAGNALFGAVRGLLDFAGLSERDFTSRSARSAAPPELDVHAALEFDGVLSKRPGTNRNFIVDVYTNAGTNSQAFPVIFDTGSDDSWIRSDSLAASVGGGPPGYTVTDTARRLRRRDGLAYATSSTTCGAWVAETMTFGTRAWPSPLCVASNTTLKAKLFSGILGASPSSSLVAEFGVFWIIPQIYPRVGLVLNDRVRHEWVCRWPMQYAPTIERNAWAVQSEIAIGDGEPVAIQARIDTGSQRIYMTKDLWGGFQARLAELGMILERAGQHQDYFLRECGRISELPSIHIQLGRFSFAVEPSMYIEPTADGRRCRLQLYDSPDEHDHEVLIGAPFIQRVVTQWDAHLKQIGFCLPI